MPETKSTPKIETQGIRVDRLALLLDLFREEAVNTCSRARLEDELTPGETSSAFGLVSRIEGLSDRLIHQLSTTKRKKQTEPQFPTEEK